MCVSVWFSPPLLQSLCSTSVQHPSAQTSVSSTARAHIHKHTHTYTRSVVKHISASSHSEGQTSLTSPLSSSLDIHPFLKFSRSGCRQTEGQVHQTSVITHTLTLTHTHTHTHQCHHQCECVRNKHAQETWDCCSRLPLNNTHAVFHTLTHPLTHTNTHTHPHTHTHTLFTREGQPDTISQTRLYHDYFHMIFAVLLRHKSLSSHALLSIFVLLPVRLRLRTFCVY